MTSNKPNPFAPKATAHKGKGSKIDTKPSRHAQDAITGGHPADRMMSHYGKKGGPASQMAQAMNPTPQKGIPPFAR